MKKKKHRQIGFKPFQDPESDEDIINKHSDSSPDVSIQLFGPPPNLTSIIEQLYIPAINAEMSDELISHIELVETINTMCDCPKGFIFDKMIELNFLSKTIEGNLYWLVNNR